MPSVPDGLSREDFFVDPEVEFPIEEGLADDEKEQQKDRAPEHGQGESTEKNGDVENHHPPVRSHHQEW